MSKKCTPLWREAHFQVKMHKTNHCRTTVGSCDAEKVRAVVARSTFGGQNVQNTSVSGDFWKFRCRKSAVVARSTCGGQNVQNTSVSDDFWKLQCRKSARRCGATHLEFKMCKTPRVGRLCKLRCRKSAHRCGAKHICEVKMLKTLGVRTTFGSSDLEKVHAVVARSTFGS